MHITSRVDDRRSVSNCTIIVVNTKWHITSQLNDIITPNNDNKLILKNVLAPYSVVASLQPIIIFCMHF